MKKFCFFVLAAFLICSLLVLSASAAYDFDFNFNFDFSMPDLSGIGDISIPDLSGLGSMDFGGLDALNDLGNLDFSGIGGSGGSGGGGSSSSQIYISKYDGQYLNESQYNTVIEAKNDYMAAQNRYDNATTQAEKDAAMAQMKAAHGRAEDIRRQSAGNYSGGVDGSEYIPYSGGGSGGYNWSWVDDYTSTPTDSRAPAGTLTVNGITLTNSYGDTGFTTFKAGYGFSAKLDISLSNATFISAYATMSNGDTCQMELVDGTVQFVPNPQSPTQQRKYYVPVTTLDGEFTATFTINAVGTNGNPIDPITRTATFNILGTMYDDDHSSAA